MLKKIIVHPGRAHLDDMYACAMAVAGEVIAGEMGDPANQTPVIERKEPSQAELDDAEVLVLDVGRVHDPARSCFDHHQLPRGTEESAMTLLAKHLSLPDGAGADAGDSWYSVMNSFMPWFQVRAEVDSCGPFATAGKHGVDWSEASKFLGPCEEAMLTAFEEASDERRHEVLKHLVRQVHDCVVEVPQRIARVRDAVRVVFAGTDPDVQVLDFTQAPRDDVDAVQSVFTDEFRGGVAMFLDDRGPGLALLRLRDDPRIDFSKTAGMDGVAFAHAGGFIAKTADRDFAKAMEIVKAAVVRN